MIRRDHPDLSISQQCKLVKLSRAAFYYMPVGVSGATLELMKAIDRAFTKYPFLEADRLLPICAATVSWSAAIGFAV